VNRQSSIVNGFTTAPGLYLIYRLGPHHPQIHNVKERLNPIPIAIGMEGFNGLVGEANCALPNPYPDSYRDPIPNSSTAKFLITTFLA
jgi:hypothetical protein